MNVLSLCRLAAAVLQYPKLEDLHIILVLSGLPGSKVRLDTVRFAWKKAHVYKLTIR